ncbi:MAG: carbonic anhydrase [Burkholderiales bacterium]|nr:carbonic anhydrase [Burkholderiales bacterium]
MKNFHLLIKGFQNFKKEFYAEDRNFYEDLKHGQKPLCLVISCCDSRVDPAILLDCNPGELFVVRNVAALIPAEGQVSGPNSVLAAVEYGINHLHIKHIIVMGHSNCGGIAGLMNPHAICNESFIFTWLTIANSALDRINELTEDDDARTRSRHIEEGAILLSINNLLSYDWIREKVDRKELELHALYIDIEEGNLYAYDPVSEDFELLTHDSQFPGQ